MKHIYIEAKNNHTTEYFFLKAIISELFPEKKEGVDFKFYFLDGVDNLFNEKKSNIQTFIKKKQRFRNFFLCFFHFFLCFF